MAALSTSAVSPLPPPSLGSMIVTATMPQAVCSAPHIIIIHMVTLRGPILLIPFPGKETGQLKPHKRIFCAVCLWNSLSCNERYWLHGTGFVDEKRHLRSGLLNSTVLRFPKASSPPSSANIPTTEVTTPSRQGKLHTGKPRDQEEARPWFFSAVSPH